MLRLIVAVIDPTFRETFPS